MLTFIIFAVKKRIFGDLNSYRKNRILRLTKMLKALSVLTSFLSTFARPDFQ